LCQIMCELETSNNEAAQAPVGFWHHMGVGWGLGGKFLPEGNAVGSQNAGI
jgi:hypothetical protein